MTSEEYEIQQFDKLCQEYRKKINELEDKIDSIKQDSVYWFGQANRNYEDCHTGWTKKIQEETVKELRVRLSNVECLATESAFSYAMRLDAEWDMIFKEYGVEVK